MSVGCGTFKARSAGLQSSLSGLDLHGPPTFARPQDHAVLEKLSAFNGRNHPAESASKVDSVAMLGVSLSRCPAWICDGNFGKGPA